MEWVPKTPFQWDWETLELFSGKQSEISKPAQVPELRFEGGAGIWNGSVCSSGGGASSILELGNHSSRSSLSTSLDSSPEAGKRKTQFYFDSVQGSQDNLNILTRADDTGTSPLLLAASCPKEPLTGLKLGQTYFEDIGVGNDIKSSSSSAPMASSTAVEKKARVSQQNIQNPYCQVEGCNVDLTTAKDYHRKHRVCENHSKSPKVIVAGQERRFCQQCSRFHGLSEFDQKKRSCRRRLSDHNARRRKPQPTTISFNSSRLSSSYYENRRQMNLVFGQGPLDHVTTAIGSTWDDTGNFKLVHPKESWMKSNKASDISAEPQFSSTRQIYNISTRCHDWDGIFPSKGTTAEVLNQDVEACAFASNLDGAPDLRRALSLLSNDSWGPTKPGGSSNIKMAARTKSIYAAHPAINTIDSTVGFLQNEQPLAQPTMLPFNLQNDNGQFQEFQLFKSPFQTSFFDSTRIH